MILNKITSIVLALFISLLACSNEEEGKLEEEPATEKLVTATVKRASGGIKSSINEGLHLENSEIEVIPDEEEVEVEEIEELEEEEKTDIEEPIEGKKEDSEVKIDDTVSKEIDPEIKDEEDLIPEVKDKEEVSEKETETETEESTEKEADSVVSSNKESGDEEENIPEEDELSEEELADEEDDESSDAEINEQEEITDEEETEKDEEIIDEEIALTSIIVDSTNPEIVRVRPKRGKTIFRIKKHEDFRPGTYRIYAKWKRSEFADNLSLRRLSIIEKKRRNSRVCQQDVASLEDQDEWNLVGVFYLTKKARVVIKNRRRSLFTISNALRFDLVEADSEVVRKKRWKCLNGQIKGFGLK
ncbi:MAG: hypothetical protein AB8G05_13410 [Oligoflexales bacterium]